MYIPYVHTLLINACTEAQTMHLLQLLIRSSSRRHETPDCDYDSCDGGLKRLEFL